MRPGPRIVKPPTAKQRASAQAYSRRSVSFTAIPPETMPTSSWWIGKSREELQTAVADEQLRIRHSKLGRINDPTFTG